MAKEDIYIYIYSLVQINVNKVIFNKIIVFNQYFYMKLMVKYIISCYLCLVCQFHLILGCLA